MVLIPGGTNSGTDPDFGAYSPTVSAFYMGKYEVTKAKWDEVRAWGVDNGYTDLPSGGGKGPSHPVHSVSWYDVVKWCNARSKLEERTPCYTVSGNVYKAGQDDDVSCNESASGYRLPTDAEWEYAARGGVSGQRFSWGDTIDHSHANYRANSAYPEYTYHPTYNVGMYPYTSPVGSFAANGYGLYDMAGNVWEWDWYPEYDGSYRLIRGGGWISSAGSCRAGSRGGYYPDSRRNNIGFRACFAAPVQ